MATLQDINGTQKLRDAWPKIELNEQAINTQVVNHVAGTTDKHNSQDINYSGEMSGDDIKEALDNHIKAVTGSRHNSQDVDYSGAVAGAENIKEAADSLQEQITNLSFTGSEHDALVTAALADTEGEDFGSGGYGTYLNGRHNKWERKITDIAKIYINAIAPPAPLMAAIFDGETDIITPINAMINYLVNLGGGVIIIPSYTEGVISELLTIPNNVSVLSFNSTLNYTGLGEAVVIDSTERTIFKGIKIVKNTQNWSTGADTTSIGIKIKNARYCDIEIDVEGFNKGVVLNGDADGVVHNNICIKHIYDCRYGFVLSDANAGWVNSNYSYGGRIGYRSSTIETANINGVDAQNIRLEDNGNSNNNNVFKGIALEMMTSGTTAYDADTTLVYCNGQQNDFIGLRYEITGAVSPQQVIRFDTSSIYNKIIGGRWPTNISTDNLINDSGTRNVIWRETQLLLGNLVRMSANSGLFRGNPAGDTWGGDDDFPGNVVAQNTSVATEKLFVGLDPSGNKKFAISGYGQGSFGFDIGTIAVTQGSLQWKDRGETGYPGAQAQATTDHATTASTSAINLTPHIYLCPTNSVTWVEIMLIGRRTDNTKTVFKRIAGSIVHNGTAYSVGGQTELASHVTGGDTSTAVLGVSSGGGIRCTVTPQTADEYVWTANFFWQSLSSAS